MPDANGNLYPWEEQVLAEQQDISQGPVPDVALNEVQTNPDINPPSSGYATLDDIVNSVAGPAPAPVVKPLPGSSGSGQSFSVSKTGADFSPGGLYDQAASKGLPGMAAGTSRVNAYGEALGKGRAENIDEQRAATSAIGEQEALKAEENARLTNEMATREREMAVDNAKDYAAIQTKVASKMADYENAVNELSVMGVNPGRMYSNLTDPMKAGVLVTAFVTDFLGAKGIKTHGMDYINQAIERDIQSQRDAIDLKKDVAQGKMNIYKMFKEQGDSDYLAAEKTRGALFKAFHTEVMGKLAAFDSPLVRAKMQQADALLKEKKLDVDAGILKETMNQFNQEHQFALTERAQNMDMAKTKMSLAQADRHFQQSRKDAAGKDAVDPERVMYNTEGKPMGYVSKEDNFEKVAESVTAIQGMTDILDEYATAIQRSGRKWGGPGSAAFEGDVEVARKSLEGQLTAQIAKMNNPDGKISDNDIAAAKAILSSPTMISGLLSGEDPVQAAIKNTGGYGRRAIKQHHDYLKVHLRQITDEEAAALRPGGARAGTTGTVDAKGTNFGIMERGDFGRAAPETPTDKAVGKLGNQTGEEQNSYVSIADDKDGSLAEYWMPHIAGATMRPEVANTQWGKASMNPETAKAPRWLGALDDLYDKARESNSAERDTAVNALWEQTKNPDPDISGAAQYYIDKLPTVFSSPDPWDK